MVWNNTDKEQGISLNSYTLELSVLIPSIRLIFDVIVREEKIHILLLKDKLSPIKMLSLFEQKLTQIRQRQTRSG